MIGKRLSVWRSEYDSNTLGNLGGGPDQANLGGGQSREIFRGGPVKKITLYEQLKATQVNLWASF